MAAIKDSVSTRLTVACTRSPYLLKRCDLDGVFLKHNSQIIQSIWLIQTSCTDGFNLQFSVPLPKSLSLSSSGFLSAILRNKLKFWCKNLRYHSIVRGLLLRASLLTLTFIRFLQKTGIIVETFQFHSITLIIGNPRPNTGILIGS